MLRQIRPAIVLLVLMTLLTGVVVIVVGLTYFPVVALGPIVEHLVGKF